MQNALPSLFFIDDLASCVVNFIHLDQWGEWVWQATQRPCEFVCAKRMLRWRKSVPRETVFNLIKADNYEHLNLLQCSIHREWFNNMEPNPIVDIMMNWVDELLRCSEQTMRVLAPLVTEKDCCEALTFGCSSSQTEEWRLRLLALYVPIGGLGRAYSTACATNNVCNAKLMMQVADIDHTIAYTCIRMDTSVDILNMLFDRGCSNESKLLLRKRFLDDSYMLACTRSVTSFRFWFEHEILVEADTKHLFEMAFATNNAVCVEFFHKFASRWTQPPQLDLKSHINNDTCLDVVLHYHGTDVLTTLCIIPLIKHPHVHAEKVVLHALQRGIGLRLRSIIKSATRKAWKNKNVSLLKWIWANYPTLRQTVFTPCFKLLKYCTTHSMIQFLFTHESHRTRSKLDWQRLFMLRQAVNNNDVDIFQLLCSHKYVTHEDLNRDDDIGTLLFDLCCRNIEFLQCLWTLDSPVCRANALRLICTAFLNDNVAIVDFLFTECEFLIVPQHVLVLNIPLLCRLNRINELRQIEPRLLTKTICDIIVQDAYTAIRNNVDFDEVVDLLWTWSPLNADLLLADDGLMFTILCNTNMRLTKWIWNKRIITARELFNCPGMCQQTLLRFSRAINFDIDL